MLTKMSKPILVGLAAIAVGAICANALAQGVSPPFTPAERQGLVALLTADEAGVKVGPASSDEDLRALALRFAEKEAGQRLRPTSVNRLWAIEPPRRDISAELASAQQEGRLIAWLTGLSPADPGYAPLKAAFRQYADLSAAGGWAPLPATGTIRAGSRSTAVLALRKRLSLEGYQVAPAADPERFDEGLAAAVAAFQSAHGIAPDGAVGPATRSALNVSANDRLEQIEANLERQRWTPRSLPTNRVVVDTGLATATLTQNGPRVLTMRVVVGKPSTPTPMFISRLDSVVLNPPWNVPPEIAAKEILPKAARDAGYLSREGFVRTTEGGLRQLPGPKNALGQMKFDLQSPFGVYLHDTPNRSAFARDERHLSHGCMRLEKPHELAEALLNWSAAQLSDAVADGETKRFPISQPPTLFVIHTTAFVDAAGRTNFRADAYGWDHKLAAALKGASATFAQSGSAETDCAVVGAPRRN